MDTTEPSKPASDPPQSPKSPSAPNLPLSNIKNSAAPSHPSKPSKKTRIRRKKINNDKKTYTHIGIKTSKSKPPKTSKNSPSNSTLNSTLSYFPSLKLHKSNAKNSKTSTIKDSQTTQRTLLESSATLFNPDAIPSTQVDTSSSFFRRDARSLPRKRLASIQAEKDRLGREKLHKYKNRKHTDYQVGLLKNRVKRLKQEEINAQKKIHETKRRAEKFMEARFKYDVDQSIKYDYRYHTQRELEQKRDRINQERKNSYERKKQIRMGVIESKLKEGLKVKQGLYNSFKNRDIWMNQEMRYKKSKIQRINQSHSDHSKTKFERHNNQCDSNRKRVEKSMKDDEHMANANISKMKQLEKQEQALMSRLQNTLSVQQEALSEFENMVLTKKGDKRNSLNQK